MDPVKMKLALALCLTLGLASTEPVFAQSPIASAELSGMVDGLRRRCGLGLLARTTSAQTCQSFKDYGSRMQCVANELSDEVRTSESQMLGEVAGCYRALGDALVSGRGANVDQVNALEDVCRNLRHETVVPRSPSSRDALLRASDALMSSFSRGTVLVPTVDPMMGIRLHDLPDCAMALSVLPGLPSAAGALGPSRVSRAGSGGITEAVQSTSFAYGMPSGVDPIPATSPVPLQAASVKVSEGQATNLAVPAVSITAPKPVATPEERLGADKLPDGLGDRMGGKSKVRSVASDPAASTPISESAVISALPAVSTASRKPVRRTTDRAERRPANYSVAKTTDGPSLQRKSSGAPAVLESDLSGRSSNSKGSGSGYSASSPPSLPLMGPPPRPKTAGSVR
jgi:hypothetical protein